MRAVQVVGYHQPLDVREVAQPDAIHDLDAGRVRGRAILVP